MTASPEIDKTAQQSANPSAKETLGQGARMIIDLGPIAVFAIAYNVANRLAPDTAIYWATGLFMASTFAAIAANWLREKRVPPMLLFTSVLVLIFGSLTFVLKDSSLIKMKPTAYYALMSLAVIGSILLKRNLWKMLFGSLFTFPDRIWDVLALRWVGFFVFMAVVNEVVWRTQSEAFWVNFRLVAGIGFFLVFALANTPLTLRWNGKTNADYPGAPAKA